MTLKGSLPWAERGLEGRSRRVLRGRLGMIPDQVVVSLLLPVLRDVALEGAFGRRLGFPGLGLGAGLLLARAEVRGHDLGRDLGAVDRVVLVARAAEGILPGTIPKLDLQAQKLLTHQLIPGTNEPTGFLL